MIDKKIIAHTRERERERERESCLCHVHNAGNMWLHKNLIYHPFLNSIIGELIKVHYFRNIE